MRTNRPGIPPQQPRPDVPRIAALLLLALAATFLSGCRAKLEVEAKQYSFTEMELTLYREKGGSRVTLGKQAFTVQAGDHRLGYETGLDGRCRISLPEGLPESVRKLSIDADGLHEEVAYRPQRVLRSLSCGCLPQNYFRITVSCDEVVRREEFRVAPESEFKVTKEPVTGPVKVRIGPIERDERITDGVFILALSQQELPAVLAASSIEVVSGDRRTKAALRLPPQDNTVGFGEKTLSGSAFTGTVENRTLESKVVKVTAGCREGESWLVGHIIGRRYFVEKEAELAPGEVRRFELEFPAPLFGTYRTDVDLRVVR